MNSQGLSLQLFVNTTGESDVGFHQIFIDAEFNEFSVVNSALPMRKEGCHFILPIPNEEIAADDSSGYLKQWLRHAEHNLIMFYNGYRPKV